MNTTSRIFAFTALCSLALAMSLMLGGCASHPSIDWDKRIGNYSYDDMKADFGEPWSTKASADGSKTCTWAVFHRQSWSTRADPYDVPFHEGVGSQDPKDHLQYYYSMTFDSRGILMKWKTLEP